MNIHLRRQLVNTGVGFPFGTLHTSSVCVLFLSQVQMHKASCLLTVILFQLEYYFTDISKKLAAVSQNQIHAPKLWICCQENIWKILKTFWSKIPTTKISRDSLPEHEAGHFGGSHTTTRVLWNIRVCVCVAHSKDCTGMESTVSAIANPGFECQLCHF